MTLVGKFLPKKENASKSPSVPFKILLVKEDFLKEKENLKMSPIDGRASKDNISMKELLNLEKFF